MNQGRTKYSDEKSVRNYDSERWITSSSPGGWIWDQHGQSAAPCQITQPRAASTASFTWRQSSGPRSQASPGRTAQGACCSRCLVSTRSLRFLLPKAHTPARPCCQTRDGALAWELGLIFSRAVCYSTATDQPASLWLHTGRAALVCFNPGVLHSTLSILDITFGQHRLRACSVVLPLAKAHPKPSNPQCFQKVHFVPWEALRCILWGCFESRVCKQGEKFCSPYLQRDDGFLLK